MCIRGAAIPILEIRASIVPLAWSEADRMVLAASGYYRSVAEGQGEKEELLPG